MRPMLSPRLLAGVKGKKSDATSSEVKKEHRIQ
jgi:hypothetical protein